MTAPKLVEVDVNPDLKLMEENEAARKARITRPRWNPKEWHPVYEEVVLLDCLGYARTIIAAEKGFTEEHITNILKTDHARLIREVFRRKLEVKVDQTIDQRFETIAHKAMKRVEEVMNNDTLAEKNPLGLFDRAIVLLKAAGKIKDEPKQITNNTLIVSDEQMDKLTKGIAVSDEARRLHGMTEILIGEDAKSTP